jgi:Family of unknown function (DUF6444)
MEPLTESPHTSWSFPFVPQDWEHTPATVQSYVRSLHDELTQLRERVEALEARLTQNSTTSHRPPSSDSPTRSLASAHPRLHPAKRVGNPAIWAIARRFCPLQPCARCGPSSVPVATRPFP